MIWHLLDIFFVVFHTSLIFFNLFGWIWRKTRIFNLITLLLTGSSWLLLGLIVGTLGYCPLTDWHFAVLNELGESSLPSSYIKYIADGLTGLNVSVSFIDRITLLSFLAALIISILYNIHDFRKSKRQ